MSTILLMKVRDKNYFEKFIKEYIIGKNIDYYRTMGKFDFVVVIEPDNEYDEQTMINEIRLHEYVESVVLLHVEGT